MAAITFPFIPLVFAIYANVSAVVCDGFNQLRCVCKETRGERAHLRLTVVAEKKGHSI